MRQNYIEPDINTQSLEEFEENTNQKAFCQMLESMREVEYNDS